MRFRLILALVALLVIGVPGIASAETETGTLELVHDISDGPAVVLIITPFGTEDPLEPVTIEPDTEFSIDLPAGTHTATLLNAEDDSVLLEDVEFTIEAGVTLTIVASEVLGGDDDDETGTLEFVHDITDGPAVGLIVTPFGTEAPIDLGTVEPGTTFTADLPAGTHLLTVTNATDGSVLLEDVEFTIEAGKTTRIVASEALAPGDDDDDDDDDDDEIPVPTKVDTGAGGTAGSSATGVLAAIAGLAVTLLATLRLRRVS